MSSKNIENQDIFDEKAKELNISENDSIKIIDFLDQLFEQGMFTHHERLNERENNKEK